MKVVVLLICLAQASALHAPALGSVRRVPALRANKVSMDVTITPPTTTLLAARSGGRIGGRVGGGMRGGGGYGGGGYRGGGYGGGGMMMAPPMFSPFGFFSPFSPFGFGFGFGLPTPLLLFALAGLALTSFRDQRMSPGSRGGGIGGVSDEAGAALCLQLACFCDSRQGDSLYGRLQSIARTADTNSYSGLQRLVSDTCLAMLRSNKDWLAARTKSETAGVFSNDVESGYNRLVVQERAKWEVEQNALTRTSAGQPTYFVATLVVLLRSGSKLPDITGVGDLRDAISQLAGDVTVEDNLIAAEVLWTPEDDNDTMDREDMFMNFPELVSV